MKKKNELGVDRLV